MEIFPEVVAFDYCISLGHSCDVANSLIDACIRDASYPFDWCFTKVSKIKEFFENDFTNFFERSNLIMSSGYVGHPASDKGGGIIYVHDGKFKELMRNDTFFEEQKNKYNRRVKRLYEKLNNDNNILFIHILHPDAGTTDIFNLIETVSNKNFKSNIKFLILSSKKDYTNLSNENVKFIRIQKTENIWEIVDILKKVKVVRHYRHRSHKISAWKGSKKYNF
tara:strand:+ start:12638 stop:13300 length:663 start_codon:yes stop_codon:yes gene_type:complete